VDIWLLDLSVSTGSYTGCKHCFVFMWRNDCLCLHFCFVLHISVIIWSHIWQ